MRINLYEAPVVTGSAAATEDPNWWAQNREDVEAKFIGMLMAETTRKPYTGPERRTRATVVLDPADLAVAQAQAGRLGIPYEEHVRRLFHRAVMAEGDRHIL
jgi:hypothetical protein